MNYHLIRAVESWLDNNRDRLKSEGVELDERISAAADKVPWKISFGFVYESQIVEFTIWQRHINEAEIDAIDTATGEHFPIELLTHEQIDDIPRTLDLIAEKLLAKGYRSLGR
jgi:hypothetical protein